MFFTHLQFLNHLYEVCLSGDVVLAINVEEMALDDNLRHNKHDWRLERRQQYD